MNSFLLASGNRHKAEELNELFRSSPVEIVPAESSIPVDENGTSYHENALLKARAYSNHFSKPCCSDDSGLTVLALPGELGIHSARFGGEELGYEQKNQLLLEKLDGKSREAYFSCVLCFYYSEEEYYFFEGRVNGKIGFEPKGTHGFGYDPIFLPDNSPNGETLAMIPDWKKTNSHRAVAAKHASDFFYNRSGS